MRVSSGSMTKHSCLCHARSRKIECVAVQQGRHCSRQFATYLGVAYVGRCWEFGLQKVVAKFRVGLRYEKMLSLCSSLVPADRALEVVTLQTARRYFHARCTGPRILPEMAICWLAHHIPRQAYCWTHCNRSRYSKVHLWFRRKACER